MLLARSKKEENNMREKIDRAFTKKEQKEMGLVFISVKNTPRNVAGRYFPEANPKQVWILQQFGNACG